MPGMDGRGPRGLGTQSGRGRGKCLSRQAVGIGAGLVGAGMAMRNRRRNFAVDSSEDLQLEKEQLEKRLQIINDQLDHD